MTDGKWKTTALLILVSVVSGGVGGNLIDKAEVYFNFFIAPPDETEEPLPIVPPPPDEEQQHSYVVRASIVAIVPDTAYPESQWWNSLDHRNAPQVPADPAHYHDIVKCEKDHRPMAAWTEVHTSWPSVDVMYTVNAWVVDGSVGVTLRSRQGYARGYAYLDVFALCLSSSTDQAHD